MEFNMKAEENFANMASLQRYANGESEESSTGAYEASERFLHSAKLLPNESFIGWQIDVTGGNTDLGFVFSSKGLNVSVKDYNWIFHPCAVAKTKDLDGPNAFSETTGKTYVLSSVRENTASSRKRHRYYFDDYDDDKSERKYMDDMAAMLEETKAIVRIIAEKKGGNEPAQGNIMIILPDEMPLRMRSILSFLFKYTEAVEVHNSMDADEGFRPLPEEDFLDNMAEILFILMSRKEKTSTSEESGQNGRIAEEKGDSMKKLDDLVALDDVKNQIREIAAFARMRQDMPAEVRNDVLAALNMEFVGNPGTAKTTVARICAGILKEIGLLSSSELVEVGRADLIGKYQGYTEDKVKEVFRRAKGKLLFIDEAYALAEYHSGGYGDEAINVIVQEMENNREDTIVIFAGYPDQMKDFFSRNPGLRSRVPFQVHFFDYTADEMFQIAEVEAKRRHFQISPQARETVLSICGMATGNPEMGNGRFCRNLVEKAILKYASRMYGGTGKPDGENLILSVEDFSVLEIMREAKRTNTVGFRI